MFRFFFVTGHTVIPLPRETTVRLTIIRKNIYMYCGQNAAFVLKKGVHAVTSVFRRLSSKCEVAE